MELQLDHTFDLSDFLIWYRTASPGDVCPMSIPAMQDWTLTITKTAKDSHILLHPDGHQPQSLPLDELLHMLQSLHRAMVALRARGSPASSSILS
jgi:hypothetical protein